MDDFEKVRNKLADDMTPSEVEIIMANQDKLNEEEKAAFANLITENTPLSDDPLSDAINSAVDDTVTPPAVTPEAAAPITPTPQPPVATPPVIAQGELDAYLETKKKEWDEQGKTAAEQKKETDELKKLFDEGYAPADWNEFSVQYLEKVAPIIEKRIMDRLEAQNTERTKAQEEMRSTAQKIYEGFEAEFKGLAEKGNIPAQDAPEYKQVHDAIIAIGDKYDRKNITEAYELWSMIPKDKGGGLDYAPPAPADPNAKIKAQKEAAGRIGSARGSATPAKKANDWNTIHGTDMQTLIDNRLQQS